MFAPSTDVEDWLRWGRTWCHVSEIRSRHAVVVGAGIGGLAAALALHRPDGRWLQRADSAAMTARYGSPPLAVHRAALADALTAGLPHDAVRYGAAVTAVEGADDPAR